MHLPYLIKCIRIVFIDPLTAVRKWKLDKDCPSMANLIKPTKRKRGQKFLSKTVLNKNRRISKKRVKIENAFAGVKRLKITWDIFRNIKEGFSDKVFWIACGIWNLHLS